MKSDLTPTQAEAMAEHHSERSKHRPAKFFQSLNARLAAHESAGFVAMQDAATRLAAKYPGEDEKRSRENFHLQMCEAWANGKLPVYSEGSRIAIDAPDADERRQLKEWKGFGPGGMRKHLDPNRSFDGLDLVKLSDLDALLLPSGFTYSEKVLVLSIRSNNTVPVPRFAAQENSILSRIRSLGYDPRAIPRNQPGKSGLKADVRHALGSSGMFTGRKVFDHAWERLRSAGEIADMA